MAGLIWHAQPTAEIALVAATVKTLLQIVAPANQVILIHEVGIAFDGVAATDEPIIVDILRQTTAGTSTSHTLLKRDSGRAETIQATCGKNHSVEPTAGDILYSREIHPQRGELIIFPIMRPIWVPGGTRLAIRATAPNNVNAIPFILAEE